MRKISLTFGWVCALAVSSCSPNTAQERWESDRRSQALGRASGLTKAEWAAYVADQNYLNSIAKPDVPVQLNYADPRQYNFALSRLKLVGKTAANSPYLFALIEARRQKHVARGLKAGEFDGAVQEQPSAARSDQHFIGTADIGNISGGSAAISATNMGNGSATSSFPGGCAVTFVDASISDAAGMPIVPPEYKEEFENLPGDAGTQVTVNVSGDLSVTSLKRYIFGSYRYVECGEGDFLDTYIHTEVGSVNPVITAGNPQLRAPTIIDPVDKFGADGRISICMDRAWTNDCDYILNGGPQSIKVSLKGSISIASEHVFDVVKIQDIKTKLSTGQPVDNPGFVKLVLANVGGGCDVTDGDTLFAKMSTFWNRVEVSPDKRTFSWDMTEANAAFFDEGCRQVQDSAVLTMRIPLPLRSVPDNQSSLTSMTITSDPTVRPQLLPITLTNSCLAEGTQIQLGDGKQALIESLHIGQNVFNPYDRSDHALTITDTAKGSETAPMVRIRDEAGRTLLMTDRHPIATADRGMVQARALRAGDVVMTTQGPSKLAEVSREPYGGKVYNLKVGSDAEKANLGQDQTVVYANGFVVGDGQIQSKYEALEFNRASRMTAEQVPERWRRDFMLSPRRK